MGDDFGKYPVRTELTVLPADDSRDRKLGFVVTEYMGSPVYKRYSDGTINTANTLKAREDIQEGDELAIPWITGGYALMRAKRGEDGKLFAQGDPHIVILCFDEDDRHCWTTGGFINTRGLARLEIKT